MGDSRGRGGSRGGRGGSRGGRGGSSDRGGRGGSAGKSYDKPKKSFSNDDVSDYKYGTKRKRDEKKDEKDLKKFGGDEKGGKDN